MKGAGWALHPTVDMSGEYLDMIQTLMLAQAQKCFFEKAQREDMKPAVLGMLAAECAALYREVDLKLASTLMRSHTSSSFQVPPLLAFH